MPAIPRLDIASQTAAHLRKGLAGGLWKEGLPGVRKLAEELGVSHDSVRAALKQLETEGLIAPQGRGRRRRALSVPEPPVKKALRVAILLTAKITEVHVDVQRDVFQLRYGFEAEGHICVFPRKTQADLHDDPERCARLAEETHADCWILISASQKLIEWFAAQPTPALAWGGRCIGKPIASVGMDISPAMRTAIQTLGNLGHRRIVLVAPRHWRLPDLGSGFVRVYFDELAALGVRWSDYNIPEWRESPQGLKELLESLFRVTPPQALIVDHPSRLPTILGFLGRRGLRVPKDLSLLSIGKDETLSWSDPPIAHMCYDEKLPIRHILKWVQGVAGGKRDRKCVLFPASFDPAESIGPARA